MLLPILGLAFFVAFIPHRDYAYPVHLDEWQVLAYTNQLMKQGSTAHLTNPVYGGGDQAGNQVGELGTHIFWGIFKETTGMDWMVIFRYFPAVVFMLAVLSVFVLAERQGFGWQAALLASLLPTTNGTLGPAFLVPISLAILFLPLALLVAFNFRGWWSYPVLSILVVAAAAIHPPTAAVLLIVLVPYILINLKGSPGHSVGMTLAVVIPFAALLPLLYRMALPYVNALFLPRDVSANVALPSVVPTLGYVPVLLCIVGVTYLSWKGKMTDYGLLLGTATLLALLAIFFTLHYGVDIVYYRGLQVAMLMVSILAGAGLMVVGRLRFPKNLLRLKTPIIVNDGGRLASLALVALTLAVVIPARLNAPYYHMIDREDYRAFTWVEEDLSAPYDKAIIDPWQGMAFVAIAGKAVFSFTGETPDGNAEAAYAFLDNGCNDTAMLRKNGISIVYSKSDCNNADLVEARDHVYLLERR